MNKYKITVFLFVFSFSYVFAQTPVKSRKIKGEWELQIKVAEAVAEETKDVGVFGKSLAGAVAGFVDVAFESVDGYWMFEGKNLTHFDEDGSRVKNVYLIRRR